MGITRKQAIALYESKAWEGMTQREIAEFQMVEERLCMPVQVFHKAIEETLGRPVFTHEFSSAGREGLLAELFDGAPPPSLEEILELIPADKRIVIDL